MRRLVGVPGWLRRHPRAPGTAIMFSTGNRGADVTYACISLRVVCIALHLLRKTLWIGAAAAAARSHCRTAAEGVIAAAAHLVDYTLCICGDLRTRSRVCAIACERGLQYRQREQARCQHHDRDEYVDHREAAMRVFCSSHDGFVAHVVFSLNTRNGRSTSP